MRRDALVHIADEAARAASGAQTPTKMPPEGLKEALDAGLRDQHSAVVKEAGRAAVEIAAA